MTAPPNIEIGPPVAEARAVVILAHGRGANAASMAELARALQRPALRFVCIGAPGGIWYPNGFMAAPESNEPWQSQAIAQYDAAVTEALRAGAPLSRIVIGGFSQGACLTMGLLWKKPRRFGGALIFTGGLIGPPGAAFPPQPALAGMPALLTNGDRDAWIPLGRSQETEQALQASGARVDYQIYPGRAHTVGEDEIARARALLDGVAA